MTREPSGVLTASVALNAERYVEPAQPVVYFPRLLEGPNRAPGATGPAVATGYVRTYYVVVNLTLSIDERLVKRARRSAAAMGKSVNQLVREYLESLTEQGSVEDFERELTELSLRARGRRRGWRFNRDEAHERT